MSGLWYQRGILFQILLLLLLVVACAPKTTPESQTDTSTLTALNCEQVTNLTDVTIQCLVVEQDGLLLQSIGETQPTLSISPSTITFDDTIYLKYQSSTLLLAPLSGISVLGTNGATRIIQSGLQITLALDTLDDGTLTIINTPSDSSPVDISIPNTTLLLLNRFVDIPQPISTPTPTEIIVIELALDCVIPEDWGGFYTIERGDTLSAIAQQFNLTLSELQDGNCITNANVIIPGIVLRVPGTTMADVTFQTQPATIQNGDCAMIEWSVDSATVVYFEGSPSSHEGAQEVCPLLDTTYTLLVISSDGNQVGYTATIVVNTE